MADTVPILSAEERAALAAQHSPEFYLGSRVEGRVLENSVGCFSSGAEPLHVRSGQAISYPCVIARLLATCAALEAERSEMIAAHAEQMP